MSDLFVFQRFANLFKLQLRTQLIPLSLTVSVYFASFAALHGLIAGLTSGPMFSIVGHAIVMVFALITFPIVCSILTASCFNAYHERSKANAMLMLPCSKLEQFAVPFLIYVILVPLVLGISTLFVERSIMLYTFESINQVSIAPDQAPQVNPFALQMSDMIKSITDSAAWISIFTIQSVFFAGAIWFKRKQFHKTCYLWIGILIFLVIITWISDGVAYELANSIKDIITLKNKGEEGDTLNIITNCGILAFMTGLAWFKFTRHKLP